MQPPYFLSRNTIEGMLKCADNPPMSYTEKSPEGWTMPTPTDCIDHYMLQIACGSGYPHFNFHTGASFETQSALGLEQMSIHVRQRGVVMVHSVKTFSVLHHLVSEHAAWKRGLRVP
jgi:hypothetical protein